MRTLVVNPPERLRLIRSRVASALGLLTSVVKNRSSNASPSFCSKESKRRRVAVKMQGKIVGFAGGAFLD